LGKKTKAISTITIICKKNHITIEVKKVIEILDIDKRRPKESNRNIRYR